MTFGTYGIRGIATLRLAGARGVPLHVLSAGPAGAHPVILLHGFPECAFAWRRYLRPLAASGFRVLAPDQRGYGYSGKPRGRRAYTLDILADDIVALADSLEASRFAIVGHDWGGVVAWHLATRNPERITAAVILNAPHPATMAPFMLRHPMQIARSCYVAFVQTPLVAEALLRTRDFALLARTMTATARPGAFSRRDLCRYREAWRQLGHSPACSTGTAPCRLRASPRSSASVFRCR